VGRLDDVWISDQAATALGVNAWADATEASYPPATGSIEAHYTLDGSTATNDVTGADANVTGSPTTGVEGIRGNAFQFTKNDDRGSTADALESANALPLDGSGATVGAWFRYTAKEAYARVFQVGGGTGGQSQAYEVIFDNLADELFVAGISNDTGNIPVEPDTWYFVVFVGDGSNVRLHVFDREGELATSPVTGGRSASNSNYSLVMMSGDDSEPAGKLDEVYAYSTALSQEGVTNLYASSEPVAFSSIPQGSLEAYYPFDGSTATNLITGTDATEVGSGSPTKGVEGIRGNAYEFTTSSDRSSTANALEAGSQLPLNGPEATVASWFRYTSKQKYARVFQIGADHTSVPDKGFSLEFDSNTTDATLVTFGGSTNKAGPITLSANTWYFFVGVVDGSTSRLHVFEEDGEVPGSPATATDSRDQTGDDVFVMMGGDHSEAAGRFDETVAYSRALSTGEVQDLFDAYGVNIGDPRVPTPYGLNANATSEDSRVTIDGLPFANGTGSFAEATSTATASTGDSIDTSNVSNSAASLYSTQDLGPMYESNVLNGTYDVTVHTAELNYTSSGQRVFNVSVNGNEVVSDLDVYGEVGHDAAYTTTATNIDVKDGSLTLSTSTSSSASAETPFREAYFSLDGSTATNAETSTDATLVGNPQSGATGQYGSAFEFSVAYLDVPQFTPSGDDSVSVACWVNLDSVGEDEFIFWGDGSPQFEFGHFQGGMKFIYYDGSSGNGLGSTGVSLSSGTWVHLAGTYDDSTGDWTLYKDGSQVASTTQSIDASFSATESLVGRHPGVGRQVNGRMDEVVFYDRALSGSEVTDLTNDTVPSSGLIAHYELDTDTPVDSSGNGNDASIVGNPDTGATGQFNGAYNLDVGGSGDGYLSYPDLGVTYDGSADWTTAMWINPTGLPAGVKHFIWHPRAKNDINLQIDSSNKEITFSTFDGNPNDLSSGVTPTTGAWTHVAVVSDTSASNQYEIFVDGTSEATGDLPDPGGVSDSNVIGGQPSGDYRYFNGLIDEVRFYDRALSASEIGDLANNGS
jgi:hypothetical protein